VQVLTNLIRSYAWGSRTAIASIQGRSVPSDGPEAELWLGAHPAAPSALGSVSLVDAIAADPAGMLGPAVLGVFGTRLPFLLKVLAAAEPLSLQVHPDAAQAAAGFAAQEAAGIPLNAPTRTYVDPFHKPELLVAVDEFDALCGFRDPEVSADALERFGVPALAPVIAALRMGPASVGLGAAMRLLTSWPPEGRVELVSAVASSAARMSTEDAELAHDLAGRYPGDAGVIVALLLNRVRLRPDEAVWMPAGNLHMYLRGVGVEIMAASDNVLRGGLTAKHVDVPAVCAVLRYEVLADPVVRPVPVAPGLVTWHVPVEEFSLHRAALDGPADLVLPGSGPRIVLCLRGAACLRTTGVPGGLDIGAGRAVFVPASDGPVTATGTALLFQAAPNLRA
jgi:mannose-6-phosphate isomerase